VFGRAVVHKAVEHTVKGCHRGSSKGGALGWGEADAYSGRGGIFPGVLEDRDAAAVLIIIYDTALAARS
jgi:hypothetical protein